ncbi:MAG: hypothetical protein U0798_07900 [Gemmataceae bacterium]
MRFVRVLSFIAALTASSTAIAQDGKWVTIKGQIKLENAPAATDINVTTDKQHCLSKGPLKTDDLVVNPKNNGIKNVVVYLRPDDKDRNAKFKPSEINPELANPKSVEHVIDQPCCQFVPRIVVARVGDTITVKNSAPVNHNIKYESDNNGSGNWNMPAGTSQKFKAPCAAEPRPIPFECNVHPWMKGQIRIFDHPYYAITDADGKFEIKGAPAGKYRIVYAHEKGYHKGAAGRLGEVIEIKAASNNTMEMKPIDYDFPK